MDGAAQDLERSALDQPCPAFQPAAGVLTPRLRLVTDAVENLHRSGVPVISGGRAHRSLERAIEPTDVTESPSLGDVSNGARGETPVEEIPPAPFDAQVAHVFGHRGPIVREELVQ